MKKTIECYLRDSSSVHSEQEELRVDKDNANFEIATLFNHRIVNLNSEYDDPFAFCLFIEINSKNCFKMALLFSHKLSNQRNKIRLKH